MGSDLEEVEEEQKTFLCHFPGLLWKVAQQCSF